MRGAERGDRRLLLQHTQVAQRKAQAAEEVRRRDGASHRQESRPDRVPDLRVHTRHHGHGHVRVPKLQQASTHLQSK